MPQNMYCLHRIALSLLSIILPVLVHSQDSEQPLCLGRSCYPATGNLLVGREDFLQASSVCGLQSSQRYCVVGDVRDSEKCFSCDSRLPWTEDNPSSHNITNIVTTFKDRLRRWWQAENGEEEAFIQLDLDAEFHFTHLIITFKTFRPKSMYIERSLDFGKTWLEYRYFAEDCKESFPDIPMGPVRSLKDPLICEEKYSNVLPASGGEVVFKVLPPHMKIDNPYSPEVQDLLKLTNLRVIFKELHTLGDDLLDQRREINEKYYYSIYDMVVRGSCSCYGHASRCVPSKEEDWGVEHMVYSKCECTHNTKGKNCEMCADFYNDRPWVPAKGKEIGECKKCECQEHATACHFDPAVYHSRGNVSGGVCDNCMHNTDGLNCELCKSHFFQDPARDLRDPYICQPCNCDPTGTQNNGECDMRNDPINDLIAGKCKCKDNVGGSRCERCQAGFWNFGEEGCIECECNTLGTFDNQGCNQRTGECTCKRFVTGRNCDQCLPGYWGLSKEEAGCSPCGCDIGGSYDNMCDVSSGQCSCKFGIQGRACDQAIPGYFVTDLDYLRYEAEFARGTGNTQVVVREKLQGEPATWTGPGFMRVFEKDSITFEINNIPYAMNYDMVIRYETQMPSGWDDVRVIVQRPDSPDPNGPCGNQRPEDDYPGAALSSVTRYHIVTPHICFEKGKTYYIKLDFHSYQVPDDNPSADILIDSIALIPVYTEAPVRIDSNPLPPGQIIYCNNLEHDAVNINDIPVECKKYMFSIGTAIQNKALGCDCDITGSMSSICEPYGGQCQCKPNVSGRQCDICSPGAYGFGPQGCLLCNCNAQGARDNFCDIPTGSCLCLPNINGRTCDRCEKGMFNFPHCEHCQCNGHSDECADATGSCIECRDFTVGDKCDTCTDGYFGDPSLGSDIPCRKCMCPGGEGSGYQHADTCSLDQRTKDMKCDCPLEFAGDKCEKCAINHFGDPLVANGTCTSCFEGCNYNIEMSISDSCDPIDGRCTACQYNTDGDSCEMCANGFFGNAVEHSCVACICNWLGADRNATEPCNRVSGQCPCLSNVEGASCDHCAQDHWKLASGDGCVPCECDNEGSYSHQCNEFDGQCQCMPGRGGKRCDECIALHYGEPTVECFPCDCNPDGSDTMQCDARTGQCVCLEGITGLKCDRCDRGTNGVLPNCVPCGECFDNWDSIIKTLRERTDDMLAQVNATKSQGAVGVYDEQFKKIEDILERIQMIIDNFNQSEASMDSMELDLEHIRRLLEDAQDAIGNLNDDFRITNTDLAQSDNSLSVLEVQITELVAFAKRQKIDVEDALQEDIIGAYNAIKNNRDTSRELLDDAKSSEGLTVNSKSLVNDTVELLEMKEEEFRNKTQENSNALDEAGLRVDDIKSATLGDINKLVCDLKSPFLPDQFCDAACGGGGCDSCGEGNSCTNGAQGKVNSAMTVTKQAEDVASNKTLEAEAMKQKLHAANMEANVTLLSAGKSREAAKDMSDEANSANFNMTVSLNKIGNFLGQEKTTPEEIIMVADQVLSLSLPLEAEQIEDLARKINETIQNLTNIDQILNETSADLLISEKLKERADNASKAANDILRQVNELNKKLSDARRAQNDSTEAIDKAKDDIAETRDSLKAIGDVMTAALKKAEELNIFVETLYTRGKELSNTNTENSQNVAAAKDEANQAKNHAAQAEEDSEMIQSDYAGVSEEVMRQHNDSSSAHRRSKVLLLRARNLATTLSTNHLSLTSMNDQLTANGVVISDVQKQVDILLEQAAEHVKTLTELENHHNKCEATDTTTL